MFSAKFKCGNKNVFIDDSASSVLVSMYLFNKKTSIFTFVRYLQNKYKLTFRPDFTAFQVSSLCEEILLPTVIQDLRSYEIKSEFKNHLSPGLALK